mmetsp:Transcript_39782/g.69888  ORF Transcript_39782/g.69888 Transcript_39782/m.69888 type:complete len:219 (+) Transcript_39782:161-817(+)
MSADCKKKYRHDCADAENNHTKNQSSCWHNEGGVRVVKASLCWILVYPLLRWVFECPVNRSYGPWQAKPKEHIDRVASRHVAHGCICIRIHLRSGLRRKGVRQGSAKCDKRNCSDLIGHVHGTSKHRCHVADDCRNKRNHQKGTDEANPTSTIVSRRNKSKEQFPRDRQDVHHPVKLCRFSAIFSGANMNGVNKLISPIGVANLCFGPVHLHPGHHSI